MLHNELAKKQMKFMLVTFAKEILLLCPQNSVSALKDLFIVLPVAYEN